MTEGEADPSYWPKEAQRRAYALEKAVRDGEAPEHLARLRESLAEADRHVGPPGRPVP